MSQNYEITHMTHMVATLKNLKYKMYFDLFNSFLITT